MKETNYLLQTYEIFLKLIYLKLLQENLNNEIIGFTDKTGEEESVYYTITDIHGSITEVYDGSSKLVWKSGYTAFGELAGETVDLIDFDGMYTGCDYDAETGLTYHWNRWRSEDGSVFISEDPARDGANWYGYAGQNPMVYTDPTGLAPYLNGIYDGDYNPDYNPGVPVEGPKTQEQQKYYDPEVPNIPETSGVPDEVSPQPKTDNLWTRVKSNIEKWHFEDRSSRNNIYEFENDAEAYKFLSSLKEGEIRNGWKREYRDACHQNGDKYRDEKYCNVDGREIVFDGKSIAEGNPTIDRNSLTMGTYNYCDPGEKPTSENGNNNIVGWSIYIMKGIGHGVVDLAPWYIFGNSREESSSVSAIIGRIRESVK